jgi:hypothetical protein
VFLPLLFCRSAQLVQAGKIAMTETHSLEVGGFEHLLLDLWQLFAELRISVIAFTTFLWLLEAGGLDHLLSDPDPGRLFAELRVSVTAFLPACSCWRLVVLTVC